MTVRARNTIGLWTLQATAVALLGVLAAAGTPAGPNSAVPSPKQTIATQSATSATSSSRTMQDASKQSDAPRTKSTPTAKPAPSRVDRCHTSMLSGSFRNPDAGVGNRWAELTLTNTSGRTCMLYGYGGMQLYNANGTVPTVMQRTPDPGPTLIRLAPGQSATATLHWSAIPRDNESTTGECQPVATRAEVIPPDETDPLSIPWNLGPVCDGGRIDNSAYHQ